MKALVWLWTLITLAIGARRYRSDNWKLLALFLGIDIVSTIWLKRDMEKAGVEEGHSSKEAMAEAATSLADEAVSRRGGPEHLVEALAMSFKARRMGNDGLETGSRSFANQVWTLLLLGMSIYFLYKGF